MSIFIDSLRATSDSTGLGGAVELLGLVGGDEGIFGCELAAFGVAVVVVGEALFAAALVVGEALFAAALVVGEALFAADAGMGTNDRTLMVTDLCTRDLSRCPPSRQALVRRGVPEAQTRKISDLTTVS